ncbi:MAG: hypothetical protein GX605_06085 [Chloroflexi bacterium]|nr:hypothetical protein [Chloroflexota bacterium]
MCSQLLRRHARSASVGLALLGLVALVLRMPPPLPTARHAIDLAGAPPPLPVEVWPVPYPPSPAGGVVALTLPDVDRTLADQSLADGTLHHLATLAAGGIWAEQLQVPPYRSAWQTQAALATGQGDSLPVGGWAAWPEGPASADECVLWEAWRRSAPAVWAQAEAQGLRAALLFWPEMAPPACAPAASLQVDGLVQDLPAALVEVALSPAAGWQNMPHSYSPPLGGLIRVTDAEGQVQARVHLLALDRRNDGVDLPDHFVLALDRDAGEGAALFRVDAWIDVELLPGLGSGAAFRVLSVSGGDRPTVTLYRSPSYHLQGRPADALQRLQAAVGPPSPPADLEAWDRGWLSAAQVQEMALRSNEWLRRAVQHLYSAGEADLLWVRWWPLDSARGALAHMSPDAAQGERSLLRNLDGELAALLRSVDLARTSVLVLSEGSAGDPGPGDGFLVAAGRGVRQGVAVGRLRATDIVPLLLELLGLPPSGGMPGLDALLAP